MNTINICICLFILLIHQSYTLKCRTTKQQTTDEIKKVIQKCKQRQSNTGRNEKNNSSSDNDTSEEEDSSDEIMFDKNFFTTSNDKNRDNNTKNTANGYGTRNFRSGHRKRGFASRSNYTRANQRKNNSNGSNRDFKNGMHSGNNSDANVDNRNENYCNTLCFFVEFNLVDERGYPERSAITRMMMRGIPDPTLRNVIEESILECFHFLSDDMNFDKCLFSRNLLNCLADKGQERCEDWNDD